MIFDFINVAPEECRVDMQADPSLRRTFISYLKIAIHFLEAKKWNLIQTFAITQLVI